MKFAIVVMLALACSANAGIIQTLPYAYHSLAAPYGLAYAHAPHISLTQGIAGYPLAYSALPSHLPWAATRVVQAAPIVEAAPIVHAAAPLALAAPSASYIAQTRGATHVAELPGHVESVASQNLEPAPGTL